MPELIPCKHIFSNGSEFEWFIETQCGIIQQREMATLSYHAGIGSGLRLAQQIIRKCMKREG